MSVATILAVTQVVTYNIALKHFDATVVMPMVLTLALQAHCWVPFAGVSVLWLWPWSLPMMVLTVAGIIITVLCGRLTEPAGATNAVGRDNEKGRALAVISFHHLPRRERWQPVCSRCRRVYV